MTTLHVVMWSGGASSWKTARLAIERYGRENVTLLFSDPNSEDEDLYRWNREAAAQLGMELVRVADPEERDPWQVFFDVRWLGNSRLAPCSKILKQDPARRWLEANAAPASTLVHVGIGWDETQRIPGIIAGHAHTMDGCADKKLCAGLFTEEGRMPGPGCKNLLPTPWQVDFPLTRPPYGDKRRILAEAAELGLEEPAMYREGYAHNNCKGLCVRAGHAQWALTLRIHPDRYAHAEEQEKRFRREVNPKATILRDWSNGGRPMTLTEFRERIEAQDAVPGLFDADDWGGCGCYSDMDAAA